MADFSILVRAVPHTLFLMLGEDNACKSAARLLDVAIGKLHERTTRGDASLIRDTAAELAALQDAGRVIDRLRSGLGTVGAIVLVYCADESPHDERVGPLFQGWAGHLADAFLHTHQALRMIDDAKAGIAESEYGAAVDEVAHAGDEVRLLRLALLRLFLDAWKICH